MVAFTYIFAIAAAVMGAQAAMPLEARQFNGACFDFGDCLIQGGGNCVIPPGQFVGKCVKPGATTSTKASTKGTSTKTKTSSAASASATGSICFDDGDCILSGGKCVWTPGGFLGKCTKK